MHSPFSVTHVQNVTKKSVCSETLQTPLWPLKPSCLIPLFRLIQMTTWNSPFLRNTSEFTFDSGKPKAHKIGFICSVSTYPTYFLLPSQQEHPVQLHTCEFYIHIQNSSLTQAWLPLRIPSRSSKSSPLPSLL